MNKTELRTNHNSIIFFVFLGKRKHRRKLVSLGKKKEVTRTHNTPINFHFISNIKILCKSTMYSVIIGGSRGGREGRTPPPGRPNSFDFMQFSGKFGVFTPPPGGFTPPPRENPGSATGHAAKKRLNWSPPFISPAQKCFTFWCSWVD